VMEGLVRFVAPQVTYAKARDRYVINGERDFGLLFYETNDLFPFVLTPHYQAQIVDNLEKQRFSVSLNAQGFRAEEFVSKRNGERRLVTIGDSTTFGIGVEESDTYPKLLESLLNGQAGAGSAYKIFNLGVAGYGPAEYYLLAKQYVNILNPDVIVVAWFTGNDRVELLQSELALDSAGLPAKVRRRGIYIDERHRWRTGSAEAWVYRIPILRDSHFAIYLSSCVARLWRFAERGMVRADEAPLPVPLDRLARGIEEVGARAGSQIVWVILPAKYDIDSDKDSVFIRALAGFPDSTVVNLVPEFRRMKGNIEAYYVDGSHFSRLGGEVIAGAVSAAVKRMFCCQVPQAAPDRR